MKNKTKNILVIVAHQDDESIGMGGTISKHISEGDDVFVMYMTDGVSARESNKKEILKRRKCALIAAETLGFEWLSSPMLPDNGLDSIPLLKVVKFIEEIKDKVNPDIIYTHSGADLNIDHRVTFEATLTAFRPQPNETWTEIRSFEVPSSSDYGHTSISPSFLPNLYIDISEHWLKKEQSLKAYKSELRESPHSRSLKGIKNLSLLRGNQVGIEMAEAFQIIRKITR